ncbi:hypothetical protein J437_LFUL003032 [Ladona fulva]|uniref:Mos1 transposase HTH domain-containing protein n=1 Tax=Ladona fulva TaxID=123851 RepID=A0A8K0JWA6_LADFU|nr:hypothetical protein J437_LFUL003032 [Ladona fulva]
MLVEREPNVLQKRPWWHVEVTFPLYTHVQFKGVAFIQRILSSGSMEMCSSMYVLCQRDLNSVRVIKFLTAEKVSLAEMHRPLKAVYSDNAVDKSTANRWAIKFCGCQPGKAIIDNETRSGCPITATGDKHCKLVDDLIQNDRQITQKQYGLKQEERRYPTLLPQSGELDSRLPSRALFGVSGYEIKGDGSVDE